MIIRFIILNMFMKRKYTLYSLVILLSVLNPLFADSFNPLTDINDLKGNPVYIEVSNCPASVFFDSVKEGEYSKVEDILLDEHGNMTEWIEYDENKPVTYTLTEYDDLKRIKKRTSDSTSGIKNYEYFYNADSKYISKRIVTDAKGTMTEENELKYTEENGNTVEWFYSYDPEKNITGAEKAIYTKSEKPLEITIFDKNGAIKEYSKFIYEKDKKTYLSYTGDGELDYSSESFFDDKGLEIRSVSKWTGSLDFLSGPSEYKYEYDDKGNWIKKTVFEGKEKFGKTVFEPTWIIRREIAYSKTEDDVPDTIKPVILKIDDNENNSANAIEAEIEKDLYVWEKVDPFDDVNTVYFSLSADKTRSSNENVSLVIRARPDETEVYIRWDNYLGSEAYVTSRIDDGAVDEREWSISTDKEATFYPGDTVELIHAFINAEKYVVKITPYNESPVTAYFDLSGFSRKAEKYREYLNW